MDEQTLALAATLLLVGTVLVAMALAEPAVRRLPLSPALVYLACGWFTAWAVTPPLPELDLEAQAGVIRIFSEIAVLLSLFAIGLKIRIAATWQAWRAPVLLAGSGMLISVALATVLAALLLPLSWPMALLLAALLAPTDPVLASDVQIHSDRDRDGLRVALSAEGALNDATAYPVVMLALGLLGLHSIDGDWLDFTGSRWLTLDLLWSMLAGLALGWGCGRGMGWAMQQRLRSAAAAEWAELLYLGAIALTYGLALSLHASPFLAVFVAGATLLRQHPAAAPGPEAQELGRQMQDFGARCERLVEVLMVLLVGAALPHVSWSPAVIVFALGMLLIVRPASVLLSLPSGTLPGEQRRLAAWFGIRGVGSMFYLALALEFGVSGSQADLLVSATLACIACSIVLHGISSTPLMERYRENRERAQARARARRSAT